MLGRVPDTGSLTRDHQGPRTAVQLSTIEAIRMARHAGMTVPALARQHRVSERTIQRYLAASVDPLAAVVLDVLNDAVATASSLAGAQRIEVAQEVARRIRIRGWVA